MKVKGRKVKEYLPILASSSSSLEKLAELSQVVSAESLASSSSSSSSSSRSSCSSSRLCSGPEEQLLDFAGVLEQQQDYTLK